jgi:hypothetical protein
VVTILYLLLKQNNLRFNGFPDFPFNFSLQALISFQICFHSFRIILFLGFNYHVFKFHLFDLFWILLTHHRNHFSKKLGHSNFLGIYSNFRADYSLLRILDHPNKLHNNEFSSAMNPTISQRHLNEFLFFGECL